MGKGRKPTPTRLKLLTGNPGKRAINKNEPQPTPLVNIEPPDWLDVDAKQMWYRIVAELRRLNVATVLDESALAVCCQEIAAYARYNAKLKAYRENNADDDTGINHKGEIVPHPYFGMRNKSAALAMRYLVEFGLTPASRTKLSILASTGAADPLDALLASRPE